MDDVRSVLLVHNDPEAFAGLEETLHQLGIRTWHGHDQAEARSVLKVAGVDLVLTDAVLPDGTWKDAIRLARGLAAGAPVIVISRLVDMRLYLDTQDAGAADFIVPPLAARELAYVLTVAMHRRAESGMTRAQLPVRRRQLAGDAARPCIGAV